MNCSAQDLKLTELLNMRTVYFSQSQPELSTLSFCDWHSCKCPRIKMSMHVKLLQLIFGATAGIAMICWIGLLGWGAWDLSQSFLSDRNANLTQTSPAARLTKVTR